ncbi:AAA family ATPase [Paenibacillus sp. strain BS8-2]
MTTHNEQQLRILLSNGPLQIDEFLKLSINLTEIVHKIHQQNETIGHLNPSTISVVTSPFRIKLTENVSQNMAYRSPEQSNLIARKPDQRSDLYALGIIFYEMLTCRLPYKPLQHEDWNYAHLVHKPALLRESSPQFRESALEAIIMILLKKNPDNRYQSAYGLLMDLKQFASTLNTEEPFLSNKLGIYDRISQFRYPSHLFGRAAALEQLQHAYHRTALGEFVSVTIKGAQGTGKTSLAAEFQRKVAELGGTYIHAQCETAQQSDPYKPILQALTVWFNQLWSSLPHEIQTIKANIQRELGHRSVLLAELLPEAKLLWEGEASSFDTVTDSELQPEALLYSLIRGITQCGAPLVLLLDDVQWLDPESLALIHQLTNERNMNGMLLVTSSTSENSQSVPAPYQGNADDVAIVLDNLQYDEVRQLLSKIVHDESPRLQSLARSAYHKTEGHPERLRKLLKGWHRDRQLYYDTNLHQWMWQEEILVMADEPRQVIRLFEDNYLSFSEQTKQLLAVASVIGMRFSSSLLAIICECTAAEAEQHLKLAEQHGMISCDDESSYSSDNGSIYAFAYNSFQQFLYATLDGDQAKWHLTIGRALQSWHSKEEPAVFLASAHHLYQGSVLMTDLEKRELAVLHERAGEQAVQLQRYQDAKRFYEQGLKLLHAEGNDPDEFTCRLTLQYAACLYYCAEIEQSKTTYLKLIPYAYLLSDKDRAFLSISQINMNALENNEQAVMYGQEALARYGWKVPRSISQVSLLKEIIVTQRTLRNVRTQLSKLPDGQHDEAYMTTAELVLSLSLPWLIHNPSQFLWLMTKFIRYGLKKGLSDSLISLICMYEMIIQRSIPGLYDLMRTEIMEPMYAVSDVSAKRQYRLLFFLGLFKQLNYPQESAQDLHKVMRRAVDSADAITANLAMIACIITHNGSVRDLDKLLSYIQDESPTIPDDKTLTLRSVAKQYSDALQDEHALRRYVSAAARPDQTKDDNYSCICKLEAAYLAGAYADALHWANGARMLEFPLDWVQNRKLRIYEALALAGLATDLALKERRSTINKLKRLSRKMNKWKGIFGQSSAMYSLIQAESNRLSGHTNDALLAYEEAIKTAKEEGHGLSEAIANERLSLFYEETGSPIGAAISVMNACMAYSDWGVLAKVNLLKAKSPELWRMTAGIHEPHNQSPIERNESEKIKHVLPSSEQILSQNEGNLLQQISSWTVEGDDSALIRNFMETAGLQVGADRVLLIHADDDRFHVTASIGTNDRSSSADIYAESIVRQVYNTGQPVCVGHAASSSYAKDRYISQLAPQAILCMPFHVRADQHPQLLYLENTLTPDVFSERSLNILELLINRVVYMSFLKQSTIKEQEAHLSTIRNEMKNRELTEPLTSREMDVLLVIADGLSNKEIGEHLGISEATVKTHIFNIYGKLAVKRRSQAIARAKELDLI